MQELLNNKEFHIEFNGHLTDHSKHAIVALKGLGASDEVMKNYYKTYSKMTPYGYGLEPAKGSDKNINDSNWMEYLGKRKYFSSYCRFFELKLKELGLAQTVQIYFPKLLKGWCGSLTHAVIHLGFALDSENETMIIEGLAYLCFSYLPLHENKKAFDLKIDDQRGSCIDALLRITHFWEENNYQEWFFKTVDESFEPKDFSVHLELRRSGLQYRIARILSSKFIPLFAEEPFLKNLSLSEVWDELSYGMTLLYLAHPGDFIILHLLTSLHAMKKIATFLSPDEVKEVQRLYWLGAIVVLHGRGEFFNTNILLGLHKKYSGVVDSGTEKDWRQTIYRSFLEEEEHNPKLVYVLKREWDRTHLLLFRVAANCFTTTPSLPASFEQKITE